MSMIENVMAKAVNMTEDEYFKISEERKVLTPENFGGLCEYPKLFVKMQEDRELRPALTESMSTGRAMNDFLAMTNEEFTASYVIADGPINPKTNKPYGFDTKSYMLWRAEQDKTPIGTEQYNRFGEMAKAFREHAVIKSMSEFDERSNVILSAKINGADCLCKVDKIYASGDTVMAFDVKTTSDLTTFARTAPGMYYPEQQAFIALVIRNAGIEGLANVQTRIAAIEKSDIPRCGIFGIRDQAKFEEKVDAIIKEYADGCVSGVFGTRFEAPVLI